MCTQHRCCTVQFKCTVQPRGVSVRLHVRIAYKDNFGLTDSVALNIRLILVICGLARFTNKVVKYIVMLISLNEKIKRLENVS